MKPVIRVILKYWGRLLLIGLVLFIGVAGMQKMKSMKKPPAAKDPGELTLEVKAMVVNEDDVQVTMIGFGDARAQRRSTISSEVRGRIVDVHLRLLEGETIPAGETLIQIDPTDYQLDLESSKADETRFAAEIERLQTSKAQDEKQLEVAQRTLELSKKDLERMKSLTGDAGVRAESARDEAEKKVHASETAVLQLRKAIDLYPVLIEQARAQKAQSTAARQKAERDLERCTLTAPFDVRVGEKFVEKAQYVSVGTPLVTLVDDRILEVTVPLKADEAMRWLPFKDSNNSVTSLRFRELEPVAVCVNWTQDPEGAVFDGTLSRVERFDQKERTVDVVVQVAAANNTDKAGTLSEGMFCRVEIPGRVAKSVFRVPRDAVTHDGRVLLDDEGRLRTANVTIEHVLGEDVLVTGDLKTGDKVLITRPTRIIEGVKLNSQIVNSQVAEASN